MCQCGGHTARAATCLGVAKGGWGGGGGGGGGVEVVNGVAIVALVSADNHVIW